MLAIAGTHEAHQGMLRQEGPRAEKLWGPWLQTPPQRGTELGEFGTWEWLGGPCALPGFGVLFPSHSRWARRLLVTSALRATAPFPP
jgi:hypothetical protein